MFVRRPTALKSGHIIGGTSEGAGSGNTKSTYPTIVIYIQIKVLPVKLIPTFILYNQSINYGYSSY
jgi:hypothetical protein